VHAFAIFAPTLFCYLTRYKLPHLADSSRNLIQDVALISSNTAAFRIQSELSGYFQANEKA